MVCVILGIGFYHQLQQRLAGYSPSNLSSLFLTPNSGNGDTYTLAYGTSPYGAATVIIDSNGNVVGTVSSTVVQLGAQGVNGTGLFFGGSAKNYNITQGVFATSTFATTTLGSEITATGTLTQFVSVPFPGLGTDDVCLASLNSAPTSTAFTVDAFISQATSTNATATLMLENGTSTAVTVGAGIETVLCFDPSF